MAVKDLKAKDLLAHYEGGYIKAARGLLEKALTDTGTTAGVLVKTGPGGKRHYLINTSKRRPGKGGKVAYLQMSDGHDYECRYGGTFRALVVFLAARKTGDLLQVCTEAGTKAGFRG